MIGRNRRQQSLRVRMLRIREHLVNWPLLDDFAAIHHEYARTQMADDGKIVGNEEHSKAKFSLNNAHHFVRSVVI